MKRRKVKSSELISPVVTSMIVPNNYDSFFCAGMYAVNLKIFFLIPAIQMAGMLDLEAWPILLASALVSGCLASVLALPSIIWPRPRVERGQGQDLWGVRLFQNSITLSVFWIAVGIGNSHDQRVLEQYLDNIISLTPRNQQRKSLQCMVVMKTVTSLWSHCSQDCHAYLQAQRLWSEFFVKTPCNQTTQG